MRHIEWLPQAYEVAAGFAATRSGRSNVYLVLLDFADRRRGPHGLYVGMSRYPPAQRFEQHKAGIHAAGSVLKRGLKPLTGPVLHLQHIARAEAARIEAAARRRPRRCRHPGRGWALKRRRGQRATKARSMT